MKTRRGVGDAANMIIMPMEPQRPMWQMFDHDPRQVVPANRFAMRKKTRHGRVVILRESPVLQALRPQQLALHNGQFQDNWHSVALGIGEHRAPSRRATALPVGLEPGDIA